MVSENTFRLGPRRVLQELFLDVAFDVFTEDARSVLEAERKPRTDAVSKLAVAERRKSPSSFTQQVNERRRTELASGGMGTPFRSVKGFSVEGQAEGLER